MKPNSTIRQFETEIVSYINQSDLPAEIKLLVMKDICAQLKSEANRCILAEQQQEKPAESEESNGAD